MMIVLVACVAFAAAEHGHRWGGGQDALAMDETTGSTGSPPGKRASTELALSDEQRGRIYEGVMHVADPPVAQPPAPAVADALSAEVAMQDLPAGVTRDVPPVRGHKFVKFEWVICVGRAWQCATRRPIIAALFAVVWSKRRFSDVDVVLLPRRVLDGCAHRAGGERRKISAAES